jgi:hypothetical protein
MKPRHWLPLLLAALLCGCLDVDDRLEIAPDGSGKVRLEVRSAVPEALGSAFEMALPFRGEGTGGLMYPPTSEAEARKLFPGQEFTVTASEKAEGDGRTLAIEASFKDINGLLASPYGRAHQLALKLDGGVLVLRALGGASAVGQASTMKAEGAMAGMLPTSMGELEISKSSMKFKFHVTLPNTVTGSTGTNDGRAASWVVVRAACKDDEEFATKLGAVLQARCPADGVSFVPLTPPRLALGRFDAIEAGLYPGARPLPDTNRLAADVKVVPNTLAVTRVLDLSGDGGEASQAHLSGTVIVPAALAPARWGAVRFIEVLDANGVSLAPKEDEDAMSRFRGAFGRYGSFGGNADGENEEAGSDKARPAGDVRHEIAISFLVPAWKVKSIRSLQAAVPMHYLSGSEVVKLTNAVPASLVLDMANRRSFGLRRDEGGGGEHPRLAELGLAVRVGGAMAQANMTAITLEISGGERALVDAQIYDADGRAWPTTLGEQDQTEAGERMVQLAVMGRPKPPFSLALAWSGTEATFDAPVRLENIPLTGQ